MGSDKQNSGSVTHAVLTMLTETLIPAAIYRGYGRFADAAGEFLVV